MSCAYAPRTRTTSAILVVWHAGIGIDSTSLPPLRSGHLLGATFSCNTFSSPLLLQTSAEIFGFHDGWTCWSSESITTGSSSLQLVLLSQGREICSRCLQLWHCRSSWTSPMLRTPSSHGDNTHHKYVIGYLLISYDIVGNVHMS